MAIAQEHRRIAISTPLGKDVLLLRGFTGYGFGLAAVPLLSLVLPPAKVVPFVVMLH